jgi:hypothetical protein
MDAPEWEVYLDDGSTMNSAQHAWDDVPERIIALKVWYPTKKLLLWGLSHYGRPDTLKAGVDVDDSTFQAVLEQACAEARRPSERIE